ncbi:flagellar hook-associated protein 3 [Pseudomonas coleopterorum]|uniref:flagellar hook-associated protein 3 n=1 Tax=Pseudomonas coleopterorum TaxID=1605838 RepID=UPI0008985261|nr:flagellar hook-associated protein 3 [Pseudomonas coleopterorum]SEE46579.1 flagellar hook-associated protein 3 FlgL [Pseudomonas coleopterorum]
MRISTSQYFETSATGYSQNFSDTAKTQAQISSGNRIQSAGDDPVGAAKLLQLQQQSSLLTQYSGNMTSVTNSLTQEESVLDSITTALQRAQELTIQAGNGGLSDADRTSIASEIGEIEKNVLGLLNTKDSNGQYMFSGSKTGTPPYVQNSDGSYTYQGDQTQLSLQVSDTLQLATNDTGYSILETAVNTSRTQTTMTAPVDANGAVVDDGRVTVSDGRLESLTTYNKAFTDGQPYKLTFTSSTQFTLTNSSGKDVTSQVSGNGTFDPKADGGTTVSLYGVEFDIDVATKQSELGTVTDADIAGRTFSLGSKPDSISLTRNAANTSTAQLVSANVTDTQGYAAGFPAGGAVIKFTSSSEYELYAQPLTDSSRAIGRGTVAVGADGSTITAAGVTFKLSGEANAGDSFSVNANSHKTQNVLDTLHQLKTALEIPVTDAKSALALKNATDSALGNLASANENIDISRGQIGARLNSLAIQNDENVSLALANKGTQSAIADTDFATASVTLSLQQTMLQASQLAFAKISQLSLFNKL